MAETRDTAWYGLFSRGARDWLRHNGKVREAVRGHLPELIAGPDLITGPSDRTVSVPVRLLEHAHFRLADTHIHGGAGQGEAAPGTVLQPARPDAGAASQGGNGEGGLRLLLEFSVDEIMDWLWEDMHLPELQPKPGAAIDDAAWVREGWDKRGVRARLDRRRTAKEAIKRRALQPDALPFTDDDLRYRQLVARPRPGTNACVYFVIDVSASMTDAERRLAKSFFYFALQGLRRTYGKVDVHFVAHTTHAWEFTEAEFFQVTGMGGTIASSAFRLVLDALARAGAGAGAGDGAAGRDNIYLFYASDGENFTEDRNAASAALSELGAMLNYIGYVETLPGMPRMLDTEMRRLCKELARSGMPIGSSVLTSADDVWQALRTFFARSASTGAPSATSASTAASIAMASAASTAASATASAVATTAASATASAVATTAASATASAVTSPAAAS